MTDVQFLRIPEAARMLALSEKAVRKLIDAGKLPRYSPSPAAADPSACSRVTSKPSWPRRSGWR